MAKTNKFRVKEFKGSKITIEEERKSHSSLALFFISNGKLIFWISLLFSITIFIIAAYFAICNIGDSSIVEYESNGVIVSFDGSDSSILNGTPITEEYASKLFDKVVSNNYPNIGVVIKLKEIKLNDRTIVYYSDNSVLVKFNNGTYLKVSPVDGKYGIDEEGIIDKKAITKEVSGRIENNKELGIFMIYLSDGSMEIAKDDTIIFVRNTDITNTDDVFYTNLSEARELFINTKIDALAPALGSVHGLYKGEPELNFRLMDKIIKRTDLPLVLHGGSGLSSEILKNAIACGISKINFNTELQIAWHKSVLEFIKNNKEVYDPRKVISAGEKALKAVVSEYISILGSKNRG